MDISAISIDYNAKTEVSQQLFKTVQHKMHFATYVNIVPLL
ncbi:hypothetical protein [Sphingobacterium sp. UT-1RO-CII-1]